MNLMPSENVYVQINPAILKVVEEIQDYLDTTLLIQATQQDVIENAIVALQAQFR